MLQETFDSIVKLKQSATASRNRQRYEEALARLDQALALFDGAKGEIEEIAPPTVRSEHSDTYGMKGGLYRRMGQLDNAFTAYEHGLRLEEVDQLSSYNLSNCILLSLELKRTSLQKAETQDRIRTAVTRMERDLSGERGDEWWAWSDLGQFSLLIGDGDKADESYRRALGTGPSSEEVSRHVAILRSLVKNLTSDDVKVAELISRKVKELEKEI